MEDYLLSRILTGEATPEEKEVFYRELNESKENEELFYQVKSLWIRTSPQNDMMDIDAEFEHLWTQAKKTARKSKRFSWKQAMKYAAAMLFALFLGGLSTYYLIEKPSSITDSGTQKYTAMKGSVGIVELPDGTKIWLNSGSQLSYREDQKLSQRIAELSGEAYFEVAHRDNCPLLVKVGQLTIRDLGTSFNLKAYPDDNTIETSLVEGKAELLSSEGKVLTALNPGQTATFSNTEMNLKISPNSENILSAWRDGKFVIRDQRLEDIFNELSRWYDISFKFEKQELRDYRYTGNIKKSTTAQHVLKMLKITTNFNYRIIEKAEEPDMVIIY